MSIQTAGTAENLILEHFKAWAIKYISQGRDGAIRVKMNTKINTAVARGILREAGYEVAK